MVCARPSMAAGKRRENPLTLACKAGGQKIHNQVITEYRVDQPYRLAPRRHSGYLEPNGIGVLLSEIRKA